MKTMTIPEEYKLTDEEISKLKVDLAIRFNTRGYPRVAQAPDIDRIVADAATQKAYDEAVKLIREMRDKTLDGVKYQGGSLHGTMLLAKGVFANELLKAMGVEVKE